MRKFIAVFLLIIVTSCIAIPSYAEIEEKPNMNVSTMTESQLLALVESLKAPLASYGYTLEYRKTENEEGLSESGDGLSENATTPPANGNKLISTGKIVSVNNNSSLGKGSMLSANENTLPENNDELLENDTKYPTNYDVVVSKCTWEMNDGFYSPVIKVDVRNNTGSASRKINLQVVFYDDDEAKVWDDVSTYLVSSIDTPLKNGYSKTGMLRSTWGWKMHVDSKYLPNISYEVYINGIIYCDGFVSKPGESTEIQTAIAAAKKLKSMLKNPSSIQVHAVYIQKDVTNPNIVLEISAQNVFGGMDRTYYKCTMYGTSCKSCSEYEYFELYNSDYKQLDVSQVAPSVEE